MGNCAGPKKGRSNKFSQKVQGNSPVLQKGQQLVTYNGMKYIINVKEIFDSCNEVAHQIDLKSINNNNNNNVQYGACSSRQNNHASKREDNLHINGQNKEFILQTFQSSSLIARRSRSHMCETGITSANALSHSHSPQIFSAPNLIPIRAV